MIDWLQHDRDELAKKVESYKTNHNSDTIEIPIYDFFVMLDSLRDVCDEWCGAERVSEIVYPVYEKYRDIGKEVQGK